MRLAISMVLLLALAVGAMGATYNVPGDGTLDAVVTSANGSPGADTIIIAAGTAATSGQIAVTDDLVITGAGPGATIVTPGADTVSGDGWFSVSSGTSLTLKDLKLDGSGKNIFSAVKSMGNLTMENCAVTNIRFDAYVGYGVDAYGPASVQISSVDFTQIERVGIRSTDVTLAVDHCSYTGKGAGTWLDYGLEIRRGCTATITSSTISGCLGVSYDDYGSCAIQAYSDWPTFATSTVTIRGNTLRDNTEAVNIGTYDPTDNTIAMVDYNDFSGVPSGLSTGSVVAVAAENNWWGLLTGPAVEQLTQVNSAPAADTSPWLRTDGIQMAWGGARLAETQNPDGGWGWPLTGVSENNTNASIGLGMARAYRATGDPVLYAGLGKLRNFLLAKTNTWVSDDALLAVQLDTVFGDTACVDRMKQYFFTPLAAGTYVHKNATTYNINSWINGYVLTGDPAWANYDAWIMGYWLASANAVGVDITEWLAGTKAAMNGLSATADYLVLGTAAVIIGMNAVDEDYTATSGVYAGQTVDQVAASLAAIQGVVGQFQQEGADSIQASSYAALALTVAGPFQAEVLSTPELR